VRLKVAQQGRKETVARAQAQSQSLSPSHKQPSRGMAASLLNLQRMHGNRFVQRMLNGATIQRKCGCSGTCENCRSESAHQGQDIIQHILQRKGSGQPIEPSVRTFMERRLGEDFGGVRVHTDVHAAQTAEQLNAVAYTVGRDIFFSSGQYRPQTQEGKRLL
jgi:Domain of unknown function (DUF4157)